MQTHNLNSNINKCVTTIQNVRSTKFSNLTNIKKSCKIVRKEKLNKSLGKSNTILFFLGIIALVVLFKLLHENQKLISQIKELDENEDPDPGEQKNEEGEQGLTYRFLPTINKDDQVNELNGFYNDEEQDDMESYEKDDKKKLDQILMVTLTQCNLNLYDFAVEEFEEYKKHIKQELIDQVDKEIDPSKEDTDELKSIQQELSSGLPKDNSTSISIPKFSVATSAVINVDYQQYNDIYLDLVNEYMAFIRENLTPYERRKLASYDDNVVSFLRILQVLKKNKQPSYTERLDKLTVSTRNVYQKLKVMTCGTVFMGFEFSANERFKKICNDFSKGQLKEDDSLFILSNSVGKDNTVTGARIIEAASRERLKCKKLYDAYKSAVNELSLMPKPST